jgi:acyl-CoA synthetase (AMP-forming)/AMP-acid ligase II
MNLAEILLRHAAERPKAPAVLEEAWGRRTRVTTFAGLNEAAARAATLLWRSGLRPGDAVLVFHPMSAELYVALLAIFRLKLVAMFLDPSAGADHMGRCCALHEPRALLASNKAHLLRIWVPALRRIPVKFSVGRLPVPGARPWSHYRGVPRHDDLLPCEADTPALLTFTSGSTGQPKAAVRTHGFLLAQHRTLERSLRLRPGEIDLTTLPIFLLANLASGVTSVVPDADLRYPGAIDAALVFAQVERHRPVSSTASPAFFERLARYAAAQDKSLPSFRKLFTGGAPVFPRLLDQMQRMTPQAEVVSVYGSTEAEPMAHAALHEMGADDRKAMLAGGGLLVGAPVEGLQLRVVRDRWGTPLCRMSAAEFDAERLPEGKAGEIVVSGAHVLPGYLHGQGDEETKFKVNGTTWHRTGDAGYLDGRGRLWLLGRCVARIEDEHGTLYPFAAEAAAYTEPNVRRAALIAMHNKRVLAVELYDTRAGLDPDEMRRRLDWAHVDVVHVCPHVPVDKRHNAKIDYPRLYELVKQFR